MKGYQNTAGHFFRTQAEAKANPLPFEQVEIPTDHAGLIAFLNSLRAPPPPAGIVGIDIETDGDTIIASLSPEMEALWQASRPYQNGDPTTPYMGSRDPAARFTCTNCGKVNPP